VLRKLERQIMENYIQVITTTAKKVDAEKIAASLVEKRLAACVQIVGPVQSTYRWEGKVEQAEEWQCLIKSRQDLFPELEQAIKKIHPYEIPEIIALTITAGSNDYRQWLRDELQST
jgi:periplasmic divalent cation tolerance protein